MAVNCNLIVLAEIEISLPFAIAWGTLLGQKSLRQKLYHTPVNVLTVFAWRLFCLKPGSSGRNFIIKESAMDLKGSKTEKNLQEAFAGESQARNKYTYFASKARKEGYVQIANIFEETAGNEKEHAKI